MAVTDAWRERLGRRYARFVTNAVVARPALWRILRGPMRAQFDSLAETWDSRRGLDALGPLEAALDRVPLASTVLDLGTGTGKAARLAAGRYPEATVVGVDISPAMIAEARRLLPAELEGRVRFEVADASALPFPDAAFDLVLLLNMIPFFDELARVTAPGAAVVFVSISGPQTPIYVSPETLRARLEPLGFGSFEELSVGEGTAVVATRRASA